MLIERQQRDSRVRFQHPIRVVTLEGTPRVIRTLTSNVSRDGLFLRMPEPLPPGMRVALSLEAGGRALALAQAEVVWNGPDASEVTERFPGCGVRFTQFMHPRAEELVAYLVQNLDTGKPLALAPPERRWMRWFSLAAGVSLLACAALAALIFWWPAEAEVASEEPPSFRPAAPLPEAPAAMVEAPAPEPVMRAAPAEEITRVTAALVDLSVQPEEDRGAVAPPLEPLAPALKAGPPAARKGADEKSGGSSTAKPAPRREARVGSRGDVKLPSGAAANLHWELAGTELRLTPALGRGAQVTRAFVLTGPARAVFDLSGASPERSRRVAGAPPYATAVRLGKQPGGTRIVIDLDSAPKRSSQSGADLVLSF